MDEPWHTGMSHGTHMNTSCHAGDTFMRVTEDTVRKLGISADKVYLAQGTLRPDLIEVCCSVLQCVVTVCCSVPSMLQCICHRAPCALISLRCVAVCCSVLQCVVTGCCSVPSMLQCI